MPSAVCFREGWAWGWAGGMGWGDGLGGWGGGTGWGDGLGGRAGGMGWGMGWGDGLGGWAGEMGLGAHSRAHRRLGWLLYDVHVVGRGFGLGRLVQRLEVGIDGVLGVLTEHFSEQLGKLGELVWVVRETELP